MWQQYVVTASGFPTSLVSSDEWSRRGSNPRPPRCHSERSLYSYWHLSLSLRLLRSTKSDRASENGGCFLLFVLWTSRSS
jgi:hypothetical protein